jgi:hypothetical protein
MKVLLLTLVLAAAARDVRAQLSEQDRNYLMKMRMDLLLDDAHYFRIDSIYTQADVALKQLDAQQQAWQKSEMPEDSLNVKVMNLNARKKEIRQVRDLDIRMELTDAQKVIYDEKIKPAKPQVLHFGMHDRATCPVCKPQ